MKVVNALSVVLVGVVSLMAVGAGAQDSESLPCVESFTLINADTDQPVEGYDPIPEGAVINLYTLPTRNLNVRANTYPDNDFGSVRFVLEGATKRSIVEGMYVWALWGDDEQVGYRPGKLNVGVHSLTCIPYTENQCKGQEGSPLTLMFNIIDEIVVESLGLKLD